MDYKVGQYVLCDIVVFVNPVRGAYARGIYKCKILSTYTDLCRLEVCGMPHDEDILADLSCILGPLTPVAEALYGL